MISPARVAAFQILDALSADRSDLPTAIARVRATVQDERDRALAAEIATGVQRWRGALDHVIATFAKRPIERLDHAVADILRLSAYQLLHLTRVPAAAVVDDGVELTRRARKRSAAGFVNAVLRAISRRRHALPLPARPSDPLDRTAALEYLSVTLSHPRWLVARWYDRFGFEATERWLRYDNTSASLTLRANRLKVTPGELAERLRAEDVHLAPARFAPDGLVVEAGHPLRGPGLDAGWFVVQDEASQLVTLLAEGRPVRQLLDACAAPGGKTTAFAAAMHNRGLIVACDVRPRRMALLARTVTASGATNVRLVQADLMQPLPFAPTFDAVFVDAPCSGLGTLRRDPDIRWRRQEADLTVLAAAQRQMLTHAADRVEVGGRLVYATCSSEPEENDLIVDAFLRDHSSFLPIDVRTIERVPTAVVDSHGYFRTSPHVHGLDAFFGAVLERRG